MADLLKGVAGAPWNFVVSWLLPSAITSGTFFLLVFPGLADIGPGAPIHSWDSTTTAIALGFGIVTLAFLLSTLQTGLYRVLEGYSWPARLQKYMTERRVRRKRRLQAKFNTLADAADPRARIVHEQFARYPGDDTQIVATALGNALRAIETYGLEKYKLDGQLFWTDLVVSAPAGVKTEMEDARAGLDFAVALFYGSLLYGAASMTVFGLEWWHTHRAQPHLIALIVAMVQLGLLPVWYRTMITASSYLATTVRALVNLGRVNLADNLGLRLPATVAAEREMWEALSTFIFWEYEQSAGEALSKFRKAKEERTWTGTVVPTCSMMAAFMITGPPLLISGCRLTWG